jgi:glycerol-3-phosphate acyltransferase PlsY
VRRRPLVRALGATALGYLIGTISSADIATRIATGGDVDLRNAGSGNPGATNAIAVLGKKWGYGVLAADVVKGGAATGIGRALAGDAGGFLAGSAAVVGHCYPVWNGFRGGKGVACAGGQFIVSFPAALVPDMAVAALCFVGPREGRGTRFIVLATTGAVVGATAWWLLGLPNWWGPRANIGLPIAASVTSTVVLRKFLTARDLPR